MSIVLLNVGSLESDAAYTPRDKRSLENLEIMIHKMNALLEELAQSIKEEDNPKKTSAARNRPYPPQKLPAATTR